MRFQYERPTTIDEAVAILADRDLRGVPLAYGSDLLVWAKQGSRQPGAVVDLTGIDELCAVEEREGHLAVGAAVRLAALARHASAARFPALRAALGTMGSVQLREGASVGGNVCTASPAGDSGPPLLAYGASFVIAGAARRREVPADELYLGPGRSAVEPGEILVEVRIPWPAPGAVGTYRKGARRKAVDLALVSVALVAWPDPSTPSGLDAAMALGAVAPTPVRAPEAEALIRKEGLAVPASRIAEAARAAARPIDDVRAPAHYRRSLVGTLAAEAAAELGEALAKEATR